MPIYEYHCPACGVFSARRPMAERAEPADCPGCAGAAARIISAPRLAGLDRATRHAHETNERSAHAPRTGTRHPRGCGCCPSPGRTAVGRDSLRTQTGHRPWMISH